MTTGKRRGRTLSVPLPPDGPDTGLSADDLYWFAEGTHHELHRKLGAQPMPDGSVRFLVWAPRARAVAVIGDWNDWHGDVDALAPVGTSGVWSGVVSAARAGHRYKFRITSAHGDVLDKADPLARYAEVAPATASIVWQSSYAWTDAAWMASRAARVARDAPISIYELHLGSWRRGPGGELLSYRDLAAPLAEHVVQHGFTHVELLPLLEHPFYGSWGYQVTGYFAPTSRHGTPDDLRAFIDHLHQRGVGVILDWVPAHFPTDAHGLGRFDGDALYEHADPRRGFHPDWTSYIFDYGRPEVRSFLVSSARSWLDDFHLDGLRFDGVASMLYRDYSRKPGEWVPDVDGSNHDREAIKLLQAVTSGCRAAHPDVALFAEESTSWPGVTAPVDGGGLGFDYKWDLGWMHDTLRYLALDPVYRSHHHDLLTFRAMYATSEAFVLPLSHDEVVHGKGSLLGKLPGDPWQQRATLRLLYGYQWTTPGKKLLFAGGELATPREWDHDGALAWDLLDDEAHAGVARWVAAVNAAYREVPALHRLDHDPAGFRWVLVDQRDLSLYAYLRLGRTGDAPVLVVLNATPVPRDGVELEVPVAGTWRELLNSDAATYGGGNIGNPDGAVATTRAGVTTLTLAVPPLGCIAFVAPA